MDSIESIKGREPNLASVETPADEAVIVIRRSFAAPRALVWRCYTDPTHLVQFWGPKGATNPVSDLDLRVGGHWRQVMRFASGNEYGYTSAYLTYAIFGLSGPLAMTTIAPVAGVKAEGRRPSFKASASFQPVPTLTTYATVSTGFRAPVVNAFAGRASVANPNDLIIPFGADSDKLKNYELGAKGRWLAGKLTANVASAMPYTGRRALGSVP